jgi:hypothetical protein
MSVLDLTFVCCCGEFVSQMSEPKANTAIEQGQTAEVRLISRTQKESRPEERLSNRTK